MKKEKEKITNSEKVKENLNDKSWPDETVYGAWSFKCYVKKEKKENIWKRERKNKKKWKINLDLIKSSMVLEAEGFSAMSRRKKEKKKI